jgi:hypothetical protein
MKVIAYILIIIISFLALKPGIDSISQFMGFNIENHCTSEKCSLTLDLNEEESPAKDCDGNNCNPFQACCTCAFLCLDLTTMSLRETISFAKHTFTYQSAHSYNWASDFWQPPRNV